MKRLFQIAAVTAMTFSQLVADYDCCQEESTSQWELNAEFLWWKAVEDSLTTAIVISDEGGNLSSVDINHPNSKWDPGFRLEIGYRPCDCDWGAFAAWTHFNTSGKHHFFGDDASETIVPQWGSLTPFSAFGADLDTDWRACINWADFELNKLLCVSSCFQLDVHGGLRAAWVDQHLHFSIGNSILSDSLHSKSDFSSLGVVAGLDARWLIGCGLSVNACAGGAILYGKTKTSLRESITEESIPSTISASRNYWISRAMTDLSLGIGWETPLFDCMMLALAIDWEHHILFNQNQFPRGSLTSSARPRDGDLTIQGLTFSATVAF